MCSLFGGGFAEVNSKFLQWQMDVGLWFQFFTGSKTHNLNLIYPAFWASVNSIVQVGLWRSIGKYNQSIGNRYHVLWLGIWTCGACISLTAQVQLACKGIFAMTHLEEIDERLGSLRSRLATAGAGRKSCHGQWQQHVGESQRPSKLVWWE